MGTTGNEIADSFVIRCSAISEIMTPIGLTEKQTIRLSELQERFNGVGKPLTANMETERKELLHKKDNPELSEGAKTYCKKWLKEKLYGRREELKSKYVEKGNSCEEEGFTLMATELVKDMVYKNKERKSNGIVEGECDLFHNEIVYDNKASWSLATFPMFETNIPDKKYDDQLKGYSWLWTAKGAKLCYTLIDAPDELIEQAIKWEINHDKRYKIVERMVYTKNNFERLKSLHFNLSTLDTFVEIPEEKRIKPFDVAIDLEWRKTVEKHVILCKHYIHSLLTNK